MDQRVQTELPEDYAWLEGGQRYVVCAFYTPNYLDQIQTLKASLEALGLNHYFKRYEPRGGWEANTRIKAEFVYEVGATTASTTPRTRISLSMYGTHSRPVSTLTIAKYVSSVFMVSPS